MYYKKGSATCLTALGAFISTARLRNTMKSLVVINSDPSPAMFCNTNSATGNEAPMPNFPKPSVMCWKGVCESV